MVGSWASELNTFLADIGYEVQQGSLSFVDVDHALNLLCEQYDSVWQGLHTLPRQAPDRIRLTTYIGGLTGRSGWIAQSILFLIFRPL